MRTVHGSPYTFSVKPKWRTVVFCFFAARSSAEAYFRSSPPRGHSTVGAPMRCEGFVAIWLRPREDIAHNHFQLLFINIDPLHVTSFDAINFLSAMLEDKLTVNHSFITLRIDTRRKCFVCLCTAQAERRVLYTT